MRLAKNLLVGVLILMMIGPTSANSILAKEYFLKAAFLYNFARLVEWPSNTFKTKIDPIHLCFLGHDPFGEALKTIRHKKARGRPLLIQRDITLDEASQCQILFISKSENRKISDILTSIDQYPILTVSELPGFAQKSGHIRFFLTGAETLSLEVNLEALKHVKLQMSSRILTLAKIVQTGEP